jgi:hypothetical protein
MDRQQPLQWWDIDTVGNLTLAHANYSFTIVAVEYFTKWIETKPVTNIIYATIKKFFWQNIIYRYGALWHVTVDNAKQFDIDMFKNFCRQIEMKVTFASVYHPQSNQVVEGGNVVIFEAIKKILEGVKKGKWIEVIEGSEKATKEGWMGAKQNSLSELSLYPKIDPMPLSSSLAKIT